LFKLSEFHNCIKEIANKEAAQIIVQSEHAGGTKVIYKEGEIATLAIPKKLILNKLEPTRLPVRVLEKEKGKPNVSIYYSNYILSINTSI